MHKQNDENHDLRRIDEDVTVTKLVKKDIPWGQFYAGLDCVYDKALLSD